MVDPHGWPEDVGDGLAQHHLGSLLARGTGSPSSRPRARPAAPAAGKFGSPARGVHHQVDDLVAEPPHLPGRKGQRGRGQGFGPSVSSPPGSPGHPSGDSPRTGAVPRTGRTSPTEPPGGPGTASREPLGVLLDAYWTLLAHDPLPALLQTGLVSLGGVLMVLLGHIVGDLVAKPVQGPSLTLRAARPRWPRAPARPGRSPTR